MQQKYRFVLPHLNGCKTNGTSVTDKCGSKFQPYFIRARNFLTIVKSLPCNVGRGKPNQQEKQRAISKESEEKL
jgi:hypothetical protein